MSNESKHTPEPWEIREDGIRVVVKDARGYSLFLRETWTPTGAIERIVACVNALAGLDPDAVLALIEAAEYALAFYSEDDNEVTDDLRDALAALRGGA